jgi:hypothetical protein
VQEAEKESDAALMEVELSARLACAWIAIWMRRGKFGF